MTVDGSDASAVADLARERDVDDPFVRATQGEPFLTYPGKTPRGSVLADTMAVPLQELRTYGDREPGVWSNKLIYGENLQVLKTLVEMKARGELRNPDGTDGFKVIYIDPPFATKREFKGKKGQGAYRDKIEGGEFLEFIRKRLIFIHELLTDDATLYVHLDWKKGHYVKIILDELFGPQNFRNEIIWWYYNKMQGNVDRFPSNHDNIYVYSKSSATYFKPIMEEREESAQLIKRIWDGEKQKLVNAKGDDGKVLYIERADKRVDDVWRLSMLQPADRKEKVDYPTQKPKTLLALVIEASSRPGDLVLDCFAGSGTTALAAEAMGRRWVAVDSGKLAIYTTQSRLLDGREIKKCQPWSLYTAGHYDNELVDSLPFESFAAFALELFGCVPKAGKIASVPIQGTRGGDPVHVFPFESVDADLGIEYLESIEQRVRKLVRGPMYILVPASRCDTGLFEDVVAVGAVTFFIMRVPYPVIEVLHEHAFENVVQPMSKAQINDAVDAFGFDFIQPPMVVAQYNVRAGSLTVGIDRFARGGLDPDVFESDPDSARQELAMMLVDLSYNGTTFRLTECIFNDELARNDWKYDFTLPKPGATGQAMIIFIDIYGNEATHTVQLAARKKAARRA